jgi:hypothetical protein
MTNSQPNETKSRPEPVSGLFGGSRGFTVVETMIFLVVSAMLFAAASRIIGGAQRRAEFNVGIRQFQGQIRDIINDVSTGYYPYRSNVGCRVSGGALDFSVAGDQGTNSDCIFIGRVIQFAPNDTPGPDDESLRILTVAGRRQITVAGQGRDVTSLEQSMTEPIINANEEMVIPNGIEVKWVRYNGMSDVGAVGLFTNFTKYNNNTGVLESSARNVNVIPVPGTLINQSEGEVVADIRAMAALDATPGGLVKDPTGGVTVCLESGTGDMFVLLSIGGNLSQLTSDIEIQAGDCP